MASIFDTIECEYRMEHFNLEGPGSYWDFYCLSKKISNPDCSICSINIPKNSTNQDKMKKYLDSLGF